MLWLIIEVVRSLRTAFRAAALATGCKFKLTLGPLYCDLRQNAVLGEQDWRIPIGNTSGTFGSERIC